MASAGKKQLEQIAKICFHVYMPNTNKERRAVYLERQRQGLCPRCGKKKRKTEKMSYCNECREFFRDYQKEKSEEINDARKALYDERKRNRQCPRCGKKHGVRYTKIICKKCLEKSYSYL